MPKKVSIWGLLFLFVFSFAISVTVTTQTYASWPCCYFDCAPGCTQGRGLQFHEQCLRESGHWCYLACECP